MSLDFGQLLGALIRERREAAGMTQRELAEESFPDLDDHEGKERRIRELEAGEITRPQAKNYTPICETLNIDRATIRELKAQAADAKQQQDSEFAEEFGTQEAVKDAIDNPDVLSRDALELLASRFEIETPHALSDAALRDLLTKKAEEYRALKAEVESIEDGLKRLSNLKAAAQDAIARVDLEEVEELLSRVQEVELEEAAKTAELRATNALLRGRVEQAYQLLSAAADSFAAQGSDAALAKRWDFTIKYFGLGRRHGRDYFEVAEKIANSIEEKVTVGKPIYPAPKSIKGIILSYRSKLLPPPEKIDLLHDSIALLEEAVRAFDSSKQVEESAGAKTNLALAFQEVAMHTCSRVGVTYSEKAVELHREAMHCWEQLGDQLKTAKCRCNYAISLHILSTFHDDFALLSKSVEEFETALSVISDEDVPEHLAQALSDAGITKHAYGARLVGQQGRAQLVASSEFQKDALSIFQRKTHPLQWATCHLNLAGSAEAIADHDTTSDPHPHLEAALAHVEAALTVYDPEHMSYDHGTATRLRDDLKARLAALD